MCKSKVIKSIMEPKKEWIEAGYVTEPVDKSLDLKSEIRRMCKEKNAIILAHYYTVGEIQDIADFVGDSLALARKAAETDAKIMVMCGVHFMAETCKLLSPDKTVLCPDLTAGCSLADSCDAKDLKKYKEEHPGYKVVSYVNTTAAVKALTDVVVTSGNAVKVMESFPKDEKIIFGPDYNLGNYINSVSGLHIHLDELDLRGETRHDLKSNGFTESRQVSDFPIRDRKVVLHVRRRRWIDSNGRNIVLKNYDLLAEGVSYSKEFADALKKIFGYLPSNGPLAGATLQD